MPNSINVSVIVPIFNVEKYLDECLLSIISQKMPKMQIILIDDGSTDNSGAICDKYSKIDKRITVIHQSNIGGGLARNIGLSIAEGEYILYVDSDDTIAPDSIPFMYDHAKKNKIDILNVDLINKGPVGSANECQRLKHESVIQTPLEFLKRKLETQTFDVITVLYLVKKELLVRNGITFIPDNTYPDQLYTFQLLSVQDANIMKIAFPYYYYRFTRPGSTTNTFSLKHVLDAAYIIERMSEFIEKMDLDRQSKEMYCSVLLISLYHFVLLYHKLGKDHREIALSAISHKSVLLSLSSKRYYTKLHKTCALFFKFPWLYTKSVEVKRYIKSVIRG